MPEQIDPRHLKLALSRAGSNSFVEIAQPIAEANLALTFWTYTRGACNSSEFYQRVDQLKKIAEFDEELITVEKTEFAGRWPITWNLTEPTYVSWWELTSFVYPFVIWFVIVGMDHKLGSSSSLHITPKSLAICMFIGLFLLISRWGNSTRVDIKKRKEIAREMLQRAADLDATISGTYIPPPTKPYNGLTKGEIAGFVVPAIVGGSVVALTAGPWHGLAAYAIFFAVGYALVSRKSKNP